MRRHADTFGTSTPKRLAISCSCEVWSNTSVAMWPPRLNGETTSSGTRTPSPSGPLMPSVSGCGSPVGNLLRRQVLAGGALGAVGGGTWSNQPSFSSYMMNSAVLDQTFGFEVSSRSTIETNHWPLRRRGRRVLVEAERRDDPGDLGKLPDFTSAAKSLGKVCLKAFSNSGVPGLRNAVKYGRTSSVSARLSS